MKDFASLVAEAWDAPFSGWDFSWLIGRETTQPFSWNYAAMASTRMRAAHAVLDMGTGGGEFFANLGPFPETVCATEGYPSNVPIARARLEPLGVNVVQTFQDDALPFEDGSFDLVLNRHESFSADEVQRILKPGGLFLTQQVGGKNAARLNKLLEDRPEHIYSPWDLRRAGNLILEAGLDILQEREEFPETVFTDIGAVVYYLKTIPWQIEGFEPKKYMPQLARIDQMIRRDGKLVVPLHRFMIEASQS
jgi:SAM-dependent methyltransferase